MKLTEDFPLHFSRPWIKALFFGESQFATAVILSVLQTLFVCFNTCSFYFELWKFSCGLFQELMCLNILFWRQLNVKYIDLNIMISTVQLQSIAAKLSTMTAVGSYKHLYIWVTVYTDQFHRFNGTTCFSSYCCARLFRRIKASPWSRKKIPAWRELANRKYTRGKEQRDISRWGTALRIDESWKRC